MIELNPAVISHQIGMIYLNIGKFDLSPCEGLRMKVEIKKGSFEDPIWDDVYIDGKCYGNRCGGAKEFFNRLFEFQQMAISEPQIG